MSFDKMARELLLPVYERLQMLERDAAAMQKVVGELALGEKKTALAFDRIELNFILKSIQEARREYDGPYLGEFEMKVSRLLADEL